MDSKVHMQGERELDCLEKKGTSRSNYKLPGNELSVTQKKLTASPNEKKMRGKNPYLIVSLDSYSTLPPTQLPIQCHHAYLNSFFIYQGWPTKFMPEIDDR